MARWTFLSLRTRLTLMNVGVLALILAVLGVVVRYSMEAVLHHSVDRILAERTGPAVMSVAVVREERSFSSTGDVEIHLERDVLRGRRMAFRGPFGLRDGGDLRDLQLRIEGALNPAEAVRQEPVLQPRIIPLWEPRHVEGTPPDAWDPATVAAARRGERVYSTVQLPDGPARVLSMPLGDGPQAVMQVAFPLAGVRQELGRLTNTLLILSPLGLLLAAAGGALVTGRALRPVRTLTHTAAQLGAHNLSGRLPVTTRDEFGVLAETFNGMLGRLEAAFQRQKQFAADASHELRTPLAIIRANAELARESGDPQRVDAALRAIERAAGRQDRILEDLLFLARADEGRHQPMQVPTSVSDVLEEARDVAARGEGAPIRLRLPESDALVMGYGPDLVRLFVNLLENARRHTPAEGEIVATVRESGFWVEVVVADNGEGIAPEHLPRLCERFYRVDSARRAHGGSGLGLSICQSIARAHGGTLDIQSIRGEGTAVTVRLPR